MRIIDLSNLKAPTLNVRHVVDYSPAPRIKPNEELLKLSRKKKRKQSAHARHRANFIIGMDTITASPHELHLRNQYLEEWHIRMETHD
jgi:predicted house-cleaning NTP pyrophosphatase (Maf/HAM1 superfamily)